MRIDPKNIELDLIERSVIRHALKVYIDNQKRRAERMRSDGGKEVAARSLEQAQDLHFRFVQSWMK